MKRSANSISNHQQFDLFLDANVSTSPDCTFIFECGKISAHKCVLCLFSPVFDKMFNGELASNEIIISDIHMEDFSQMLNFLYTEVLNIKSVLHAWTLFYIAEKYLLHNFQMECVKYIKRNFNINNLILNYEYAEIYGLQEVIDACIRDIIGYIRGVFTEYCDYHMKATSLQQILQQKNLNINSSDLMLGVVNWAIVECSTQSIFLSPENIVKLLASIDILPYLINLDFQLNSDLCDNFTKDCSLIIKNLKNVRVPHQVSLKEHSTTFNKCRDLYKISRRIEFKKEANMFSTFRVNRSCLLYGLDILTESLQFYNQRPCYNGLIKVIITEFNHLNETIETTFSNKFWYESSVFIPLSRVMYLEKEKIYSVKIMYRNVDDRINKCVNKSVLCYYMSNELHYDTSGITFYFDELDGSVIRGISCYPV